MLLNCGVVGDSCPLDSKEIKPVDPKVNQPQIFIRRPDAKAEAPILWPSDAKSWLTILWPSDAKSWLTRKDPDAGENWGNEKGEIEDEMVEWYHWLNGHEFKQTLGDSEWQGSLACCSPYDHEELADNWITTRAIDSTLSHNFWVVLLKPPPDGRSLLNADQKHKDPTCIGIRERIDDIDSWLPYYQPIRRMSMSWSYTSQHSPLFWL